MILGLFTRALKRSFEVGYAVGRIHGYVDTLDELLYSGDPQLEAAGRRISPFPELGGTDATP